MGRRWTKIVSTALLSLAVAARPAMADTATLRLVVPGDLAALSLFVARHDRLIEKQLAARHLAVDVQWLTPNGGNPLDELLSGQADIAATTDLAGFLVAWDGRSDTPQEIRGLAALARMPYQLLSRNKAISTIRDFTAKDRIAVPALKVSLPALMLEMAAADEWGAAHYEKLDALTVAHGSEAANSAMHSGKGDIDTDFARMPYADDERADPAIHRVMDSFDIIGQHNVGVVVTTAQFRDANPELCAAVVAAITEADAFIKTHRGAAAEIYVKSNQGQGFEIEDLTDMLSDPDTGFAPEPSGILRLTGFMHQIGRVKHSPDSWQQLFFPEIYKLPGS
jgi:NitT/TauT family transport system substrate-binding protein